LARRVVAVAVVAGRATMLVTLVAKRDDVVVVVLVVATTTTMMTRCWRRDCVWKSSERWPEWTEWMKRRSIVGVLSLLVDCVVRSLAIENHEKIESTSEMKCLYE
jgi:hypothetical protein